MSSMTEEEKTFADVWAAGDLAGDVATLLTCTEVEVLACLLHAYGHAEAATAWIEAHAEGDDCGDDHCRCEECRTDKEGTN